MRPRLRHTMRIGNEPGRQLQTTPWEFPEPSLNLKEP
jgi:hypothetical protein